MQDSEENAAPSGPFLSEELSIAQHQLRIRSYIPSDPLDELTELLHRAYAGLAQMGLFFMATHQNAEVTKDRLNGDLSLIVQDRDSGRLVGTVTLYEPTPDQECAWYAEPGVWRFGQFGIDPAMQRHGLGTILMQNIEDFARAKGARELACDTAEPATHLVRWYTAMGYRFIQHQQWTEVNYRSVILSKVL